MLSIIFWTLFIRFGSKLYRQIQFVGSPKGYNCALLVADLFSCCYERDSMFSLSKINQTDIIEAFKPPPPPPGGFGCSPFLGDCSDIVDSMLYPTSDI